MVLLFLFSVSVLGFLLDETCDTLDCKLDSMTQTMTRQQKTIDEQSNRIALLEEQLLAMNKKLKIASSEETRTTDTLEPSLAQITIPSFYAVKSQDQRNIAKGERIMFETGVTNVMKAYDVFSGVFKVPLKGTYGFTWSIAMNNVENHACFSLVVNDRVVGQTYLWNNGSDSVSTGFSIVEVNAGDDVFMSICNVSQPLGEIISDIYRKTTFAGWCIACTD